MGDNSISRWNGPPSATRDHLDPDDDALFSMEPLRNWSGYSIRSVRRHWVVAIVVILVVGLVGGILMVGEPASYQTSVTVLLRTEGSVTDSGTALTLDQASRQANSVITSRDSLDRMIDELDLDGNEVDKPPFGRLGDGLIEFALGSPTVEERREDLRRDLRSALSAEPASFGESILVSVTWGDAKQAKQIADLAFTLFFEDRQVAEITPKSEAVRLLTAQTASASALVADRRADLGLDPQQDAPQGSDLLTAIGVERDLKTKLQTAQLDLQRAEDGLKFQYALLQPAELPLKPISSSLPRYAALLFFVALCAVGACLLVDQRRGRVLEAWQLERHGLRVLATVAVDNRSTD